MKLSHILEQSNVTDINKFKQQRKNDNNPYFQAFDDIKNSTPKQSFKLVQTPPKINIPKRFNSNWQNKFKQLVIDHIPDPKLQHVLSTATDMWIDVDRADLGDGDPNWINVAIYPFNVTSQYRSNDQYSIDGHPIPDHMIKSLDQSIAPHVYNTLPIIFGSSIQRVTYGGIINAPYLNIPPTK